MRNPAFVSASLLAAAAFACLPASGDAQSTTDKVKQKAEDVKTTTKEMAKEAKADVSDSWLTAKTKIALYADDRVKGRQVSVETDKGTVTLKGTVDSAEAKSAAEAVAQGIDGVKSVRNDLQVVAPKEQKAVAANDKDIKKAIDDRFARDAQLKKIDVRSDAGVVTLSGEAPSIATAARASEIARGVPAVRAVRNEMTFKERSASSTRHSDMPRVSAAPGAGNVRAMQEALKSKGFDPGPIDGVHGPQTTTAVKDYQRAENLEVTGRADSATLGKLGIDAAGGPRRPQS